MRLPGGTAHSSSLVRSTVFPIRTGVAAFVSSPASLFSDNRQTGGILYGSLIFIHHPAQPVSGPSPQS